MSYNVSTNITLKLKLNITYCMCISFLCMYVCAQTCAQWAQRWKQPKIEVYIFGENVLENQSKDHSTYDSEKIMSLADPELTL